MGNARLALGLVCLCSSTAWAQAGEDDHVQAPYFLLPGAPSGTEAFPLKDNHTLVNVAGVVAEVIVTQIYQNNGATPIEAVYVFPGSTRAAVTGMQMTIGQRTIRANIREKEQAAQEYQQAKQQGRSASLLQQHQPNVFQMNVANIMPGEEVHVELQYVELLVPTDSVYELVIPGVVGPRYQSPAETGETWVANPYLRPGQPNPTRWDVAVQLSAGMPVQDVGSPSHAVEVLFTSSHEAQVVLDGTESQAGNRDFVLRYRLAGKETDAGLLMLPGQDEGFFLLTVQPPQRPVSSQIPSRNYVFVLDVSGSMHGFPLQTAKSLLTRLLEGMHAQDTFNVIQFAGGSAQLSPTNLPATEKNIRAAASFLDSGWGGGGTELLPALQQALGLARDPRRSTSIVVITDGFVTAEARAFDIIRNNLGNANLFAFGIGSSVNRHLIEGMARAGMGEPFVVLNQMEAQKQAEQFARYISSPVLTHVNASFQGLEVYDVEPPFIPDVFAQRPVVVMGKYAGAVKGSITITGTTGSGEFVRTIHVDGSNADGRNRALRYLWARQRVDSLTDGMMLGGPEERKKDITKLGLKYGMMTEFTSFVAVDSLQRNLGGSSVQVNQPLPRPAGVSITMLGAGGAGPGIQKALGYPYGTVTESLGTGPGGGGNAMGIGGFGNGSGRGGGNAANPGLRGKGTTSLSVGPVEIDAGLTAGSPVVMGSLDRDIIKRVIQTRLAKVKYCYEKQRTYHPNLAGKVVVKLIIGANGKVQSAVVSTTSLNNEKAEQCILETMRELTFPACKCGGIVIVNYPFIFMQPVDKP